MKKAVATLVLWLTFFPASAPAAAEYEFLCKMYFSAIYRLHDFRPTDKDLAKCAKDPTKWRKAYLARLGGSSGGFRGGGGGSSGSSGRSAAPDATALGLCLDAILETQALDDNSSLGLTESQILLDGRTTIVNGAVELSDQNGAISVHGFHCEVEGRKVASLNVRSR